MPDEYNNKLKYHNREKTIGVPFVIQSRYLQKNREKSFTIDVK